jgi:TPR repeat protein
MPECIRRILRAREGSKLTLINSMAALVAAWALSAAVHAAGLQEARKALEQQEFGRAARLLRPLAEQGDAAAQIELALLYFRGRGVPEDDAAAFRWFSRAAALGSTEAMYHVGNMYAFGHGVPKEESDPDQRAAQFYFEAARRGHTGAQHALGILYLTGKGVQQDRAEAEKWFRRAAAQGHTGSQRFMEASPAAR